MVTIEKILFVSKYPCSIKIPGPAEVILQVTTCARLAHAQYYSAHCVKSDKTVKREAAVPCSLVLVSFSSISTPE